jgi:hypothetical protein
MKLPHNRGGLRFFLVLLTLARGAATPGTILAGTPLLLLGTALHFWAKGCLRQNQAVAQGGPYRFVRHPFYLANAMIDAALAVMSGWWVLWAVLPFWWLAVYLPVIRREEQYLAAAFGSLYEEYARRVPCLVPWRRRGTRGRGCGSPGHPRPWPWVAEGFSWSNPNIVSEGEPARALHLLAYPLLLLVAADLRGGGLACFGAGRHGWEPAVLAALYGLAWLVKPRRKLPSPSGRGAGAEGNVRLATPRVFAGEAPSPYPLPRPTFRRCPEETCVYRSPPASPASASTVT